MFRTPQNQMIRLISTADLGNLGDDNADDPHRMVSYLTLRL